jgi:two-component system sensor histidine kinase YesM
MVKKLREIYAKSSLADKIRLSYVVLLVPTILFLVFFSLYLRRVNLRYEGMIQSLSAASQFSLDFKKDFDYETYLVIVGNETMEDSKMGAMLEEASGIVEQLEDLTTSEENRRRLNSVKKYLTNLRTYKERIGENLAEGNRYEDNIEIWENDVQIVTALIRESIFQYIYYEVLDLRKAMEEFQTFFDSILWLYIGAFVVVGTIIGVLSYFIPRSITRPITELIEVTEQVSAGDLTVHANEATGSETAVLSRSFNIMIDNTNGLLEEVRSEQVRLRKAEFQVLQAQINPHFLYNTLDAIVWSAEAGNQKQVVKMVRNLSDFFRTSLNQGKDIVTIGEELQHVRSYLEIQQVRYQDILQYEIDVPEEMHRYMIPKITIQPLVENALYHGIKNKRGLGLIRVSGSVGEDGLRIEVRDNGIGMSPERLAQVRESIGSDPDMSNTHDVYGIYNVNERIRMNFGDEYGIRVDSVYGEGTTVTVRLPGQETGAAGAGTEEA